MERTGFLPAPLRDEGLLESAITRPQMAAFYEQADLIRQATLMAVGISQAQAFLDGNKRTAFAALEVFLGVNGKTIRGDARGVIDQLEAVANHRGKLTKTTAHFEKWLRSQVNDR